VAFEPKISSVLGSCDLSRHLRAFMAIVVGGIALSSPVHAACPIELSIYGDRDGVAEIDFSPTMNAAIVTNTFRMLIDKDVVLDGIVMWTQNLERPYGMLTLGCPEGDVTGAEIEACTLWQGIVYTSDNFGNIGLLPVEGKDAPTKLILADLGPSLNVAQVLKSMPRTKIPSDVLH
jgi:hypothetical protein